MTSNNETGATSAKSAASFLSTPIMALLFIAIGGIVVWDTTSYTDADSYVFPRTVAGAMIGLSILLILQWMLGLSGPARPDQVEGLTQSITRRVLLVSAMVAAALAMPYLGFLITGLIAFAIILLASMYDPWTPYRIIVYPLSGIGIVIGFYLLFARVLQVPLPQGPFSF